MKFKTTEENKAYLQGVINSRKADYRDWVNAVLRANDECKAKEQAWKEMQQISDMAQERIRELESQILHERREHEREKDELMSQIRAYQVAFRQLEREQEKGIEITNRKRKKNAI